jgi:hypothetical protein
LVSQPATRAALRRRSKPVRRCRIRTEIQRVQRGTGTALAVIATFLGSGEMHLFAQEIQRVTRGSYSASRTLRLIESEQ